METIFVLVVFLLYLALWSIKRISLLLKEKVDPQVMGKSSSSIQKYMNTLSHTLTIYLVAIIPIQAFGLNFFSLFTRYQEVDSLIFDICGFTVSLIGLSFCLYSQIKMGKSWRVGIDTESKTDLITTGLYSQIRNPTYLGLFLVGFGVWFIWPTVAVSVFSLGLYFFLEIQVRCEEDFLKDKFGLEFEEYKNRTKRYLPYLY